jgi:hypothetical protein
MMLQKHFSYNKIAYIIQQPEERLADMAQSGKVGGVVW